MNFEKALAIAVKAHAGQKRKNDTPYIMHPFRVMLQQKTENAMIAAILHDVVEDSSVTIGDLEEAGFSKEIVFAIELLTKGNIIAKKNDYESYIKHISFNNIARFVKIADLKDNLNLNELKEITEKDIARSIKYIKALNFLLGDK